MQRMDEGWCKCFVVELYFHARREGSEFSCSCWIVLLCSWKTSLRNMVLKTMKSWPWILIEKTRRRTGDMLIWISVPAKMHRKLLSSWKRRTFHLVRIGPPELISQENMLAGMTKLCHMYVCPLLHEKDLVHFSALSRCLGLIYITSGPHNLVNGF